MAAVGAQRARRCGTVAIVKEESVQQAVEQHYATPKHDNGRSRYPEIRGLRFSPERRIYLDRVGAKGANGPRSGPTARPLSRLQD